MIKKFNVVLVIPFHNEEKFIGETLRCLTKQKVSSKISWHVLFINNKSTDNTVKVVNDFCKNALLSYSLINEPRKGTVYSRKTGLLKASEISRDIMISTDADTIFPFNFIQTTYEDLVNAGGDILVGKRRKTPEVELWKRLVSKKIFNLKRKIWNLEYSIFGPYFFGAYFAIKTSLFKDIPLFNPEKHEKFLGEDILLSRRSHYLGGNFINSTSFVIPNERRILESQIKGLGDFVGNKITTHSERFSIARLNFKKLGKEKEKMIMRRLINFEARRLIWMLADAYIFWLKTERKYNNAYLAVERGLDFMGMPFSLITKIKKDTTLNKLFVDLEKSYFKKIVLKVEEYAND